MSIEVNVTINAPGLTEALNNLAAAMNGRPASQIEITPAQVAAASLPATPAQPTDPAPSAVVQPPVTTPVTPIPTTANVQMAPPATAVPTTAPVFTVDQMARVGGELAQQGKVPELQALLTKYGIPSIDKLPEAQFGAFATELRALGGNI